MFQFTKFRPEKLKKRNNYHQRLLPHGLAEKYRFFAMVCKYIGKKYRMFMRTGHFHLEYFKFVRTWNFHYRCSKVNKDDLIFMYHLEFVGRSSEQLKYLGNYLLKGQLISEWKDQIILATGRGNFGRFLGVLDFFRRSLLFWFNHFFDSRVEIHQIFAVFFENLRNQKVILKLTDLGLDK